MENELRRRVTRRDALSTLDAASGLLHDAAAVDVDHRGSDALDQRRVGQLDFRGRFRQAPFRRPGSHIPYRQSRLTLLSCCEECFEDALGDVLDHLYAEWTDKPVADGSVSRTWMWGPEAFTDAMNDGALEGMQTFDVELEKLIRAGTITKETGIAYASNSNNLRLAISDLDEPTVQAEAIVETAEPAAPAVPSRPDMPEIEGFER